MIAWTNRCPVCTSPHVRRSQTGWVRHLTRLLFIFPIRCRHCQTRYWRLTLVPPPFSRPRLRREPAAVPVPAGVASGDSGESAALPAHG